MRTFFICALPRSRTSWLANFLTFGDVFCLHEPLVGITSLSDLTMHFTSLGKPVVGSSDCGNQYFADALAKEFPGTQFVVIRRPLAECQASMAAMGYLDHGTLTHSSHLLDEVVKNHAPLVIDYADLSQPETGEELCDYLGIHWDQRRFEMLTPMNIQPQREWTNSQVTMANINAAEILAGSL